MMWALLLLLAAPGAAQTQDLRVILKDGSSPCNGTLQVYHERDWHFVAKQTLSKADKKVACRSTLCGEPLETMSTLLPLNPPMWMKHLDCDDSKKHLRECNFDKGSVQDYRHQVTEILTCSDNPMVSLEFNCGGRVHYSTPNGQRGFICADSFKTNEANVLCRSLGCKGVKGSPTWSRPDSGSTSMISTSCLGTEDYLWQCAPKKQSCNKAAAVYCQDYREVRLKGNRSNSCSGEVEEKLGDSWKPVKFQNELSDDSVIKNWCGQMFCGKYSNHTHKENGTTLTCSDSVQVTLSGSTGCYGTVQVKHNGKTKEVCATEWTKENSAVVCRELGCGNVMMWTEKPSSSNSILDRQVKCSENDPSLWHCNFEMRNDESCRRSAYIICSGSLDVRLADGPSRCSGRLELEVEGEWQKALFTSLNTPELNAVCRHLGCGNRATVSDPARFRNGPNKFLSKDFTCDSSVENLSSCTIKEKTIIRNEKIVDITCSDHAELFFSEDFCRGKVQVKKSSKLYLLSASTDSWTEDLANAVCNETRCGSAMNHTVQRLSTTQSSDLLPLEKCGSNLSSVLKCKEEVTEANSNRSVAWVICTGSKSMTLTNRCSGFVKVCENGTCGGVCSEAWSSDSSRDLCRSLQCGNPMDLKLSPKNSITVSYSSLHLLLDRPLHYATAVRLRPDDKSCSNKATHIVCTGSLTAKFHQNRDYCSGNVKLLQENEDTSQLACKATLENKNTANIICAQRNCGTFLKVLDYYDQPQNSQNSYVLDCPENSFNFNSCSVKSTGPCSHRGLRCSGNRHPHTLLKF